MPSRSTTTVKPMRSRSTTRLVNALVWSLLSLLVPTYRALSVIKVCQNKDCCRNFQGKSSLVEILQDLTDAPPAVAADSSGGADGSPSLYQVQATGCLSKCDLGPNVCIEDAISNGIKTPLHAVALIPQEGSSNKLINAVLLIEKAQQTGSTKDDQLRLLTTVVSALDADARLRYRTARIHAQTLRAQVYQNAKAYAASLSDVEELLSIRNSAESIASVTPEAASRLHRLAAEAHEGLLDYDAAARSWQLAAREDPMFATKSKKEVARLVLLQQQKQQSAPPSESS